MLTKEQREVINNFIIDNLTAYNSDIIKLAKEKFSVSRQTIYSYIKKLIENEVIEKIGTQKKLTYKLKEKLLQKSFLRDQLPSEDVVFYDIVKPFLPQALPENVIKICTIAFSEIFNNAIDHSDASVITIFISYDVRNIKIEIMDDGVGIFKKIQKALNLEASRFAILELAKGKFTTAPTRHSGEGIFFTSRMVNDFYINSENLTFFGHKDDDWLLEDPEKHKGWSGTYVSMVIHRNSVIQPSEVYNEYSLNDKEDYAFSKTIVPVKLMQYEGETLVSRSQAKRLISRFEKFKEVILNFEGVKEIGQAFADEVFRVFANEHPQVHLMVIKTTPEVNQMIKHVKKTIQ